MLSAGRCRGRSASNEVREVNDPPNRANVVEYVADMLGREIEQDLVPEWRAKYFDYKVNPSCMLDTAMNKWLTVHIHRLARKRSKR